MLTFEIFKFHLAPTAHISVSVHSSSHFPTIEIMMLDEWKNALIKWKTQKEVAIEDVYQRVLCFDVVLCCAVRCMSIHLEKLAN